MHRRDQHLVTQMIWGRTTHIGCGWTQFPLKDNQKLVYNRLYPGGEYENFFVCNYGVGKYLISSSQQQIYLRETLCVVTRFKQIFPYLQVATYQGSQYTIQNATMRRIRPIAK